MALPWGRLLSYIYTSLYTAVPWGASDDYEQIDESFRGILNRVQQRELRAMQSVFLGGFALIVADRQRMTPESSDNEHRKSKHNESQDANEIDHNHASNYLPS